MISYLLSGWRVFVPDENGHPLYRGRVYFYDASTSEPSPVYADKDLVTSLGTYVDVDNHGYLSAVWLSANHLYKVVVKRKIQVDPETWETLWEIDDVGNPFLTYDSVEGEPTLAVNTISDLKAINPLDSELPKYVYVMGWSTPGDTGSPMLFRWVQNASGNDGHWIDPNTTGVGAWEQIFEGDIDPRKFGAIPNSGDACDVSLYNCMMYATEPHTYDSSDTTYYFPKTVHFVKEGRYKLNAAFDFTSYTMLSQYGSSKVPVVVDDGVFFQGTVDLGKSARINSSSAIATTPRLVDEEGYFKFSWFLLAYQVTAQYPRVVIIDKDLPGAGAVLSGKLVINMLDAVPANVTLKNCILIDSHDGSVSPTLVKLGAYIVSHSSGTPDSLILGRTGSGTVFKFEDGFAEFVNTLGLPEGWQVDNYNFLMQPEGESEKQFYLDIKAKWNITALNGNASDVQFDRMKVTNHAEIRNLSVNILQNYSGFEIMVAANTGIWKNYGTPRDLAWTSYGNHGIPANSTEHHFRITTKNYGGYDTPLDFLYIDAFQQDTLYQTGQIICIENCGDRLPGSTFSDLYASGDMKDDLDNSRPIFVIRMSNSELVDVIPPFTRKYFRYDGSKFVAVSM